MSPRLEHWSNSPYWTEALDEYTQRRERGQRSITVDLEALEGFIFEGNSPAYLLMEAMASVHEQEGWDGYRGAPRLILALLMHLESKCNPPMKSGNATQLQEHPREVNQTSPSGSS